MRQYIVLSMFVVASACTTVRQLRDPAMLKPDGHAEKVRNEQCLDYSVAIHINAPPEAVWALLTDAARYTQWNSTIVSLDGTIAKDETIKLVSKDKPDKAFNLKVTSFNAPKSMVWEDGGSLFLGVRNFTLIPSEGGTTFAMSETLSGGMLGLIEGSLPNFAPSFESFAGDLKKRAEGAGETAAE